MTQKAHVPALEPVTRILPEAGPLGPERETPPSSAAFLYKTIDDGTTGSSSWVPPSPSAPSTPETAIRGPIPLTNTSTVCQPASRACYARVGVYGCVRICGGPRRPMKSFTARPNGAEPGEQRFSPTGGKGQPSAARKFGVCPAPSGCLPGAQGAWQTFTAPCPQTATGGRPDDGLRHCARIVRHLSSD